MLARFFQKSEPISFVSLLFLLFLIIVFSSFSPLHVVTNLPFIIHVISVFVFFAFIIFLVNFIIEKNHLTPANYYAVLLFILILGLFPSVFVISKISLSHLFLLLAVRRIYSLYSKKDILSKLFDSGFYIGISFLLYPQSILYFFLIYFSYFIYLKIINKDLLIPLLGFITPIFICFTYFFIFDDLATFYSIIELNIVFDILKMYTYGFIIPILLLLILLFWSLFLVFTKRQIFEGKDKSSIKLTIAYLIISIFVLLLNNLEIEETIQYLFFPIAVLIGNLFYLIRSYWIKDVLLYGVLLLIFTLPFLQETFL